MQDRETDPRHGATPLKKIALGAALLLAAAAATVGLSRHHAQPASDSPAATRQMGASGSGADAPPVRLADFHGEDASPDARLVANWVLTTHDNGKRAAILVDKKDARVYVFDPDGHLVDSAPALLGEAAGDKIAPGTSDKPLSQIKPEEKTTPAGRFVAEPGLNAANEDVIWVDYKDAISMHRVRPMVAQERRLERLASLTTDDNRISFGCINLPVSFYEDVAKPTVDRYGAVIYVLPEVETLQQALGAFDVTDPAQLASATSQQRSPAAAA